MPPIDQVTDHADRAVARMTEHLRAGDSTQKLVRLLAGRWQELEEVFQDLLTKRRLDSAEGAQLDLIGKIVGQPREGRTDTVYRIWIRARMRLNRGSGTPEDILAVFAAITQGTATLGFQDQYPAAFALRVGGTAIMNADQLTTILQSAKAGGVRSILEFFTAALALSFTFLNGGGLGFGAGIFASAKE